MAKRHTMPEGISSRPSGGAWGCSSTGWVPFPKRIPRRHPLIDAVGRIDDPCDRPLYIDGVPQPSFKALQEGYPNDVCRLSDYKKDESGEGEGMPEGAAVINIGRNTPKQICLRIPAKYSEEMGEEPAPGKCQKVDKLCEDEFLLPSQKWIKDLKNCNPNNPNYPCTGVIGEIMRETIPLGGKVKETCGPLSIRLGQSVADPNWQDEPQPNGWEGISAEKTSDLFPIDDLLPPRFNNPKWFTGYGCEKLTHPFYVTTTADYGRFSPNPCTMPLKYYPRTGTFSKIQSAGGMYRNRTLNTSNTKSIV